MTGLEKAIRKLLSERDYVSFAELSMIDGFRGETAMLSKKFESLVFWPYISEEAYEILDRILGEGIVRFEGAELLVYLADGIVPRMPIAKRAREYKEPHWVPVVFKQTLKMKKVPDANALGSSK